MKHLLLLLVLIVGCSNPVAPEEETEVKKPEGEVTIFDTDQTYYESLEDWGLVDVYFKVKNTGDVSIDYYEVYFTAYCKDGNQYTGWANGLSLGVGQTDTETAYIDTEDQECTNVVVNSTEFKSY